jgi:lysozyme
MRCPVPTNGSPFRLIPALITFGTFASFIWASGCGSGTVPEGTFEQRAEQLRVCSGTSTLDGVDVSHFNGSINWGAVKSSGRSFAIASVGDGLYQDPNFAANWSGMKSAGLIRGAYQFFRFNDDPVAQANIMVQMVQKLGPGDLPAMIDVEYPREGLPSDSPANRCSKIHQWVNAVQNGTGRAPIIYTSASMWDPFVSCSDFAGSSLWVAEYGVSCPNIPSAWSKWSLWQRGQAVVAGIPEPPGGADVDIFNGTLNDLNALAGIINCGGVPNNGAYCGTSAMGPPQSPDALISCTLGGDGIYHGTLVQQCAANTCRSQSGWPGGAYCAPNCGSLTVGWWCGYNLGNANSNYVYHCTGRGGAPDITEACSGACTNGGYNKPDFCTPSRDPGYGWWCGNDNRTGGYANTLYYFATTGLNSASSAKHCANTCVTCPGPYICHGYYNDRCDSYGVISP